MNRGGRGGQGGGRGGQGMSRGGQGMTRGGGGGALPRSNVPEKFGDVMLTSNHFRIDVDPKSKFTFRRFLVEMKKGENNQELRGSPDSRKELLLDAVYPASGHQYMRPEYMLYDLDRILYYPIERLNVSTDGSKWDGKAILTQSIPRGNSEVFVTVEPQAGDMTVYSALELMKDGIQDGLRSETDRSAFQFLDILGKSFSEAGFERKPDSNRIYLSRRTTKGEADYRQIHSLKGMGPDRFLWMGIVQSLAISKENFASSKDPQLSLSMCVNAGSSLCVKESSLLQYIKDSISAIERSSARLTPSELRTNPKLGANVMISLMGVRLATTHLKYPKLIRVKAIHNKAPKDIIFEHKDTRMSLVQYFRERYGVTIDPNGVCFEDAKESFYPLEVLKVPQHTINDRINETVQAEIGGIMIMEPQVRMDYINKMVTRLVGENSVLSKKFGISLDASAMKVKGFVLRPPSVTYSDRKRGVTSINVRTGKWNVTEVAFMAPKKLTSYGVVYIGDNPRVEGNIGPFFAQMALQSTKVGMSFAAKPIFVKMCRTLAHFDVFRNNVQKNLETGKAKLDVIFILCEDLVSLTYYRVKKGLDAVVNTQLLNAKKTPIINGKDRGVDQHVNNILMKVNLKLGGYNHNIPKDSQSFRILTRGKVGTAATTTCVMALAMGSLRQTVDASSGRTIPNIVALVCSVDEANMKYVHKVIVPSRGDGERLDVVTELGDMVYDVLEQRRNVHGLPWPHRIVFFRDSLTDGMMSEVQAEASGIYAAYEKKFTGSVFRPELLCIGSNRSHQTRFFQPEGQSTVHNPQPGTVIYDNLSKPSKFLNFYLISHAGIKGTSHPVRYFIYVDDLNDPTVSRMSPEERIKLYSSFCFEQSHLFQRATRSTSLTAATYYATLVANRGTFWVNDTLIQMTQCASSQLSAKVTEMRTRVQQISSTAKLGYFH